MVCALPMRVTNRMQRLRRAIIGTAVACTAIGRLGVVEAQAQTSSAVAVTSEVTTECFVSASPMAFGVYDPVFANGSVALDGMATITLTCTKGAVATVALGAGVNAIGQTRRMVSNIGDHLAYELHMDAARMFAWRDDIFSLLTLGPATSMAPRALTVYGRVDAGQDVRAGTYTDSIIATVNF